MAEPERHLSSLTNTQFRLSKCYIGVRECIFLGMQKNVS